MDERGEAARGDRRSALRLCVGIDTCSDHLALALVEADVDSERDHTSAAVVRVLDAREIDARNAHCETLFPLLAEILDGAERDVSAISLIGVTAGPGRFTSLRIGLATAQGLALGLDARVVPVSVFEAAATALGDEHAHANALVAIVLDAGPDLHWAAFRAGEPTFALLAGPNLAPPADVARDLFAFAATNAAPLAVAGSGATRVIALISAGSVAPIAIALPNLARAAAVLALANAGRAVDPAELEPLYLRPTRAEEIRDNAPARSAQN